jgi:alanyl aminopeptidase
VAARHADRSLLDEMVTAALDEPDRERRGRILTALGDVGEPALAPAALALLLDERVDPREAYGLVVRMSRNRATRPVLWGFLEENWEAVTDRLPRSAVAYLPSLARLACTRAERSDLEVFLRPRVAEVDGGTRVLDQALERIDQCIARRAAQEASATRFLDEAAVRSTRSP